MKKLTAFSLALVLSGSAFAEGYQVNLLSAKQSAMGHVGTGMKLGAESMHFNPAGMAFMDKTADFSVGGSAVFAKASYKFNDYKAYSDNDASTPLYAYAGFRIYDNLKGGFSLTTPYGSGMNWGKEWAGSALVQDITMKSFSFQPTLSWKITDNLSIGAGVMIMTGDFSLSRALLPAGSLSPLQAYIPLMPEAAANQVKDFLNTYGDVNILSATLKGNSKIKAGFNIGVMYDITDNLTLGLSYRSKVKMKVNAGTADLTYANETAFKSLLATLNPILQLAGTSPIAIPPLDEGTFSAELPLPSNLSLGVSYRPIDKLELAFDAQLVGWSAYQVLDVQFSENVLNGYSIKASKNYKNSMSYRLGAKYNLTSRFDLRAGIYLDQSPVKDDYYNPETPGMNKIGTSLGFSFSPFNGFSIDFSALYTTGLGRYGSYTYTDVITKQDKVFEGDYGTKAFSPTLGVSYSF